MAPTNPAYFSTSTNQTTKHDPGQLVIFFDNRHCGPPSSDDQMSTFRHYWLSGLTRMGWPSWWHTPDLEVGKVRLVWYTHAGNEGHRDYPLYLSLTVLEMLESLSTEGFRPFILGWSGENPFPMIGGSEPPEPPAKKLRPKVARSATPAYSGHAERAGTPHQRVMAIIEREEQRESEKRAEEIRIAEKAGGMAV